MCAVLVWSAEWTEVRVVCCVKKHCECGSQTQIVNNWGPNYNPEAQVGLSRDCGELESFLQEQQILGPAQVLP